MKKTNTTNAEMTPEFKARRLQMIKDAHARWLEKKEMEKEDESRDLDPDRSDSGYEDNTGSRGSDYEGVTEHISLGDL